MTIFGAGGEAHPDDQQRRERDFRGGVERDDGGHDSVFDAAGRGEGRAEDDAEDDGDGVAGGDLGQGGGGVA